MVAFVQLHAVVGDYITPKMLKAQILFVLSTMTLQ